MVAAMAVMGLGLGSGCTDVVPNEDHCAFLAGDATCEVRYGDALPFCERGSCSDDASGDGCVAIQPAQDECYSPCGGQQSAPENSSCLDEGTAGEDSSTTQGAATTTGSDSVGDETGTGVVPCGNDDDCLDEAAPFCGPAGACVSCDAVDDPDMACAGADPTQPVCEGGACVQCTSGRDAQCDGDTPICDAATFMCGPCVEHGQCEPAACNLFTGACLSPGNVVEVGPEQPLGTLADALATVPAGGEGTIIVHEAVFAETITIDGGRTVALLVGSGDAPNWVGPVAQLSSQLVVTDGTAILDGLRLSGNASSTNPAVLVDDGRLWADRTQILDNVGGAVTGQAASVLVLRNCFVGGDVSDVTAVEVISSTATILYSTVGAGFGASTTLDCDVTATVDVRNSLLVARTLDPEIACGFATLETSATEGVAGGTNIALGSMDVAWFEDYVAGDFHLASPPAAAIDAAVWQQGDPTVDIDGEPRPDIDGTSDAVGADVP